MTLDSRRARRVAVLSACGATPDLIEPLLAYGESPCRGAAAPPVLPLDDEPHVSAWQHYVREAGRRDVPEVLARHLVQLRFPIRAGMSREPDYLDATRRGRFEAAEAWAPGPVWHAAGAIRLDIASSMGGRVPMITAPDRRDFETLVRALTARNEPVPVPASMGACLVKGLNNWSRVADRRARWEAAGGGDWDAEFAAIAADKSSHQDRLLILGAGPYSATTAEAAGVNAGGWHERSLAIRREHELTHYFVYRACGVMRTHVFDEVIADFIGISRAFGGYRPDLALRVLGLEAFPAYRAGGRLENYDPDEPWAAAARPVLQAVVHRAVHALASLAQMWPTDRWNDLAAVGALTYRLHQLSLEEIASDDLAARIAAG